MPILYCGNKYFKDFYFYHPDCYRWQSTDGDVIFTNKCTGEITRKTKVVVMSLT